MPSETSMTKSTNYCARRIDGKSRSGLWEDLTTDGSLSHSPWKQRGRLSSVAIEDTDISGERKNCQASRNCYNGKRRKRARRKRKGGNESRGR